MTSQRVAGNAQRRGGEGWHLGLICGLLAVLLAAQQLALVCCLPCVQHAQVAPLQADANAIDDESAHAEHAAADSHCQSCAKCVPLLAMLPWATPAAEPSVAAAPQVQGQDSSLLAVASVPFAARAPPAA